MPDINLLLELATRFSWLGNWLFFILAFIESAPFIGMFIPGATFISIGGFLAAQGYFKAYDIIVFATLGAIFGDFFSYSLGRFGGDWIKKNKIINSTLLRHGEDFFIRYGDKSIFFGRFFGPIRAIIPFIAGLSNMKRKPFVFWNILSAIGWAILNVGLGYFSGTLIALIFKKWSGRLSLILILLLVVGLIYWLIKKRGESIAAYFRAESHLFSARLHALAWFIKLRTRYPFIDEYFKETKHAREKLFGGLIFFIFLITTYLLVIILDVF